MTRGNVRSTALLFAAIALLAAAGAAAAQGGSSEDARHQQALDRAREAGIFGSFSYDTAERGQARGDFVSYDVDESTGTLHDYQVDWADRPLEIFDSVSYTVDGDEPPAQRLGPAGPYLAWRADDGTGLTTYDRPHGATIKATIGADGGTVTLDLAEGVTADLARSDNPTRVTLTGSDEASPMCQSLASRNLADVNVGNDTVTFTFDGEGQLVFTIDPPNAGEEEIQLRRALDDAMVQGDLGPSVSVTGVEGTPAQLAEPGNGGVVMARQAGDGYVRAEVAAGGTDDVPSPRPWHISIDRQNLDATADNIRPKFDGERVQIVDNVDEILDGSDKVEPQGYILPTEDTLEVVLSPGVPDYDAGGVSMHTIIIEDDEIRTNPWPPIRSENPIRPGTGLADHVRQTAADQTERRNMIHDQTLQDGLDRAREAGLFGPDEVATGASPFLSAQVQPSEGRISDLAVETGNGQTTLLAAVHTHPNQGFTPAEDRPRTVELAGEDVTVDVADAPGAPTSITAADNPTRVTIELPAADGDPPSTFRVADGLLLVDYEDGVGILRQTTGDIDIVPMGSTIELHLGPNAAVEFSWSPDRAAVEDGPWESTETGATYRTSPSGKNFVQGIRGSLAPGTNMVSGAAWATDDPVAIPGGWSDWSPAGGDVAIPGGWSDWVDTGPRVGAEARLVAAGNQTVGSVSSASVGVTPGAATETGVSATVVSDLNEPSLIGFLVPKEDLNGTSARGVSVTLDGASVDEEPVDEILQGLVRGDAYAASDAGDVVHVLLQIEEFSEHDVTISGDGGALGAPGPGLLAVLGAAGAASALAGRRRSL